MTPTTALGPRWSTCRPTKGIIIPAVKVPMV